MVGVKPDNMFNRMLNRNVLDAARASVAKQADYRPPA